MEEKRVCVHVCVKTASLKKFINIIFINKNVMIQNTNKLPRLLAWKGGTVMSKLEILNESWINSREWEELEVRCLRAKAFFIW